MASPALRRVRFEALLFACSPVGVGDAGVSYQIDMFVSLPEY
jgi:hypothetical protein